MTDLKGRAKEIVKKYYNELMDSSGSFNIFKKSLDTIKEWSEAVIDATKNNDFSKANTLEKDAKKNFEKSNALLKKVYGDKEKIDDKLRKLKDDKKINNECESFIGLCLDTVGIIQHHGLELYYKSGIPEKLKDVMDKLPKSHPLMQPTEITNLKKIPKTLEDAEEFINKNQENVINDLKKLDDWKYTPGTFKITQQENESVEKSKEQFKKAMRIVFKGADSLENLSRGLKSFEKRVAEMDKLADELEDLKEHASADKEKQLADGELSLTKQIYELIKDHKQKLEKLQKVWKEADLQETANNIYDNICTLCKNKKIKMWNQMGFSGTFNSTVLGSDINNITQTIKSINENLTKNEVLDAFVDVKALYWPIYGLNSEFIPNLKSLCKDLVEDCPDLKYD